MQSTTLYLYNQTVNVFADTDSKNTYWEYDMFNLPIKIYKGIDNKVQLLVKNNDQQPINLTGSNITFNVLDANNGQINFTKSGNVKDARRGIAEVLLTESEIDSFDGKYLRYSTTIVRNEINGEELMFVDAGVNAGGTIELIHDVYPTFITSITINVTNPGGGSEYVSDIFSARPEINHTNALHTVQLYFNNYTGDFIVEATMSNSTMPLDAISLK